MHIKSFGFRGLRKLNLNRDSVDVNFKLTTVEQFHASTINIIVGPNGGGKSTVVDLVRAMGDATVLPTIARENITTDTSSGFVVQFKDGKIVSAQFRTPGMDDFELVIELIFGDVIKKFRCVLKKAATKSVPNGLSTFINSLSTKVGYRCQHNETGIPVGAFINALNSDGKHLSGLAPFPLSEAQEAYMLPAGFTRAHNLKYPIKFKSDKVVSISFNDDQRQNNTVPIIMLPSGWRAFGGLVAWLSTQRKGSICVIEEPETHIHPKLLRLMMSRISENAKTLDLQIFITTHSSTLIDINTWPDNNVSLFEADGHRLRELTTPALALKNLGVRPSDVCQSNGVIWVEGASDRIYLLHWLKLWCEKNNEKILIENIHFSFVLYGGAMLKHFSEKPSTSLIEIFKINQNSIIVMDRDLDFDNTTDQEIPKNSENAKARFHHDIGVVDSPNRYNWITQGYTIESYLPAEFREKYFEQKEKRLIAKKGVKKVRVADKFQSQFSDFDLSYQEDSNLPMCIKLIHSSVIAWND